MQVVQLLIEEEEPGWNERNGFLLPEKTDSAATRFGLAFEDAVVKLANKVLGGKVTRREKYFENGYLSAHIDGVINGKLFEGKTTSSFSFRNSWGEKIIPRYYQCQVAHNLMLSGLTEAVVVCLEFPKDTSEWEKLGWSVGKSAKTGKWIIENFNGEMADSSPLWSNPFIWAETLFEMGYFHQYEIAADKAAQEAMLESYAKTWELVKARKLPEPEDMEDLRRLFPEPKGTLIIPAAIEAKVREYRDIKSELSDTGTQGKRAEQIKTELVNWIRTQKTTIDTESTEKLILRNEQGDKCGQVSKTKTGKLSFV
ncbi:hypothetical protein FACS1894110_10070 [Spirochaetia bacterium]|nr:hypothetical protein FACS1894110_10070 [Spirochaetia bacterium]